MATLTIRNLTEETRLALKSRAAENNRSMEAEVRSILEASVTPHVHFVDRWLDRAESLEGEFDGPARSAPREIDLE